MIFVAIITSFLAGVWFRGWFPVYQTVPYSFKIGDKNYTIRLWSVNGEQYISILDQFKIVAKIHLTRFWQSHPGTYPNIHCSMIDEYYVTLLKNKLVYMPPYGVFPTNWTPQKHFPPERTFCACSSCRPTKRLSHL